MSYTDILEGDSIDFAYGTKKVLSGIYLPCATGKVTGLLGRNGAGKSTLLNILFGTTKPDNGSVRWNSSYIKKPFAVPGLINYMPQHPCIPGHLTIKKLLQIAPIVRHRIDTFLNNSIVSRHFTTPFNELSTGERKLLEALLFLHMDNKFVLLDEPFSFLSPLQIDLLLPIIRQQTENKGVLLTDHRYEFVLNISDEVLLLKNMTLLQIKNRQDLAHAGYIN